MIWLPVLLTAAISLTPIKAVGDWNVGCDNGGRCQALAMPNDEDSIGFANAEAGDDDAHRGDLVGLGILITREAGPAGAISVAIMRDTGKTAPITIAIDEKQIVTASYAPSHENFVVNGPAAMRLIRAMVAGAEIEITAADQRYAYTASLNGLAATMRHIDAAQGRVGTVTAIVATGGAPSSSVRAAAPLPRIAGARPVLPHAIDLPPPTVHKIRLLGERARCRPPRIYDGVAPEAYRLDDNVILALYVCDQGQGDTYTIPFIVRGPAIMPARFDLPPQATDSPETHPVVSNAEFDPKTGILSSGMHNNCGTGFTKDYVWDGRGFRLVDHTRSEACSGGFTWITLWRADLIGR